MKIGWPGRWAAICVTMIVVTAGAARSAPALVSGVFEYEIERAASGKPAQKLTQKIWVKGPHVRRESATPQGKQVVINNPDAMIVLFPDKNQAMKMPMPPGAKINPASAVFPDMAKIKEMKKTGTEKVGPYMTEIHEGTQPTKPGMPPGQGSARFWISDRVPVPVKIMSKSSRGEMTMTLKSAQPNASIPDSMFEIPKGTKIIDRPMQQSLPPAPKGK